MNRLELTGLTTRWPALTGAAWFPVVTDGLDEYAADTYWKALSAR